jgi:hypothetical protein
MNYSLTVQTDEAQTVVVNGKHVNIESQPLFEVRFSQGCVMTPMERRAAVNAIKARGEHALGAVPYTTAGVIDSQERGIGGHTFQATDEMFRIAGWRSDDPANYHGVDQADLQAKAEDKLLDPRLGFGVDWVLVEAGGVPKPWPAYHDAQDKEIPVIVKALGLDPQFVLEYEQATADRPVVVKALEAMVGEHAEEAFENRPLEAAT